MTVIHESTATALLNVVPTVVRMISSTGATQFTSLLENAHAPQTCSKYIVRGDLFRGRGAMPNSNKADWIRHPERDWIKQRGSFREGSRLVPWWTHSGGASLCRRENKPLIVFFTRGRGHIRSWDPPWSDTGARGRSCHRRTLNATFQSYETFASYKLRLSTTPQNGVRCNT